MKIDNDLKEILQIFYADGRVDGALGLYQFDEVLNEHKSKILALGKPEPLAKNKQFDNACDKCNGSGIMKIYKTCDRCYGFGDKQA